MSPVERHAVPYPIRFVTEDHDDVVHRGIANRLENALQKRPSAQGEERLW